MDTGQLKCTSLEGAGGGALGGKGGVGLVWCVWREGGCAVVGMGVRGDRGGGHGGEAVGVGRAWPVLRRAVVEV